MTNAVYPKYKERCLETYFAAALNIDTDQDGVWVYLLDLAVYSYSAAHDFLNDINGRVGSSVRITSTTITSGVFDGANITFTSLSGNSVEGFMLYRNNSLSESNKTVVFYCDTDIGGFPLTPNGGNVTLNWDNAGIFSL